MTNKDLKYSEYIPLKRRVGEILRLEAKMHPVVVLLGPRGVGKSELLCSLDPFASWKRVRMGDYDDWQVATSQPESLWREDDQLVVEEAQRSAPLLARIEQQTVSLKRKTRFVISCSEITPALERLIEQLGGRAAVVPLTPLSVGEVAGLESSGWLAKLLRGQRLEPEQLPEPEADPGALSGFPLANGLPTLERQDAWYEDYVAEFLERDLPRLARVESVLRFRRLMVALAAGEGEVPNQSALSRQLQMSQPSVYRHLGLLERAGLLVRVNAWTKPCSKRLLRSAKMFWVEPGLARHLGRRLSGGPFDAGGGLTAVMNQLRAAASLTVPRCELYYWRTTTGKEVDFVIAGRGKTVPCAVVNESLTIEGAVKSIAQFQAEYDDAVAGVVVTEVPRIEELADGVFGIPWWHLA